MGLFCWVDYECACPNCGGHVKDFQSKYFTALGKVKPWEVDRFYASCPDCKTWIQFERTDQSTPIPEREPPPEPPAWREGYKMRAGDFMQIFKEVVDGIAVDGQKPASNL